MAPANKCLVFALIADLTNWHYAIKFNRPAGLTSCEMDWSGLPVLVALIVLPFLLVRGYRLLRTCLALGVKIPRETRFVDWRPCVLLYPLVCHTLYTSVGFAPDGVMYTRTFSYGSTGSVPSLIASILLIILYQFYTALKLAVDGDHNGGLSRYSWMPQTGV
jgi:hypothetical protein